MKSRVFVSCSQNSADHRRAAHEVCGVLRAKGFTVYLAVDVQTIYDINDRIIRELKNSDYYLLVNFRRDCIETEFRGSLFSNQELAIAYAFGFERLLVINQAGIRSEGMLKYMGINTEFFNDCKDCVEVVSRVVQKAEWETNYSRRLSASGLRLSASIIRSGYLQGRFLYLDIHNHRPDIAALESTAKLSAFSQSGQQLQPSPIRSPLKATGRLAFHHTIFPRSHEAFDLLCIGEEYVALNSALDLHQMQTLNIGYGVWTLRYQFFAVNFPILTVDVALKRVKGREPCVSIVKQDLDSD